MKNGFTILEFLVVISIFTMATTSLFGGMLYLRNTVRIDNLTYLLKGEIQNTQNVARSSFAVQDVDYSINIGWIIELRNNSSGDSISLEKRPAYIVYSDKDFDFDVLKNLRDTVNSEVLKPQAQPNYVFCDGNVLVSGSGNDVKEITIGNLGNIDCSDVYQDSTREDSNDEIFTTLFDESYSTGYRLKRDAFESDEIPNCFDDAQDIASLFFSSGFGQVSFKGIDLSPFCQIGIESRRGFGSISSIRINRDTGTVETCSGVCKYN